MLNAELKFEISVKNFVFAIQRDLLTKCNESLNIMNEPENGSFFCAILTVLGA
jgi:hypothetical protein